MVPKLITHYYLSDRKPFLNLSDLEDVELDKVLHDLEVKNAKNNSKRVYGKRYMELRKKTEVRLRKLFIEAGGTPKRISPHYFVLGESYWFKNLSPNTKEIQIPINFFNKNSISFTFPDSFISMGFMPEFGIEVEEMPYHNRVFKIGDLHQIISKYGMPSDDKSKDYDNYAMKKFEKFIEIQVWDDSPLEWLNS
jgi:hypothetical protein